MQRMLTRLFRIGFLTVLVGLLACGQAPRPEAHPPAARSTPDAEIAANSRSLGVPSDETTGSKGGPGDPGAASRAALGMGEDDYASLFDDLGSSLAVSYTHLTLPTILRV